MGLISPIYWEFSLNLLPFDFPKLSRENREIVQDYYADPFDIDISVFPDLDSFPVDKSEGRINWEKIVLPEPCVDGKNNNTFVMTSRGDSDNLIVYLEGGGAGTDWSTCNLTTVTLNPKFWLSKLMGSMGIFNRGRKENPFKDWTFLYIPYGTGDVHSGNRVMKYTNLFGQTMTVHHTGYVNSTVAMRWIAKQRNFENIVLSGSSAGGYGTFINFNTAHEIFAQPIIGIADAGPALSSERDDNFSFKNTSYCWGYQQNLVPELRNSIRKGQPAYLIEHTLDNFEDSSFGFFEDRRDLIIGSAFLKYAPWEFENVLLDVTSDLKENNPEKYYRFLPRGLFHTAFPLSRFYSLKINNLYLCDWVKHLINGNPKDSVE